MQAADHPEGLADLPVRPLEFFAPTLPFECAQLAPVLPIAGRTRKRTIARAPRLKPEQDARDLSQPMTLVAEFHRAFGLPLATVPTPSLPDGIAQLRVDLLVEEVSEFVDATKRRNLVEVADALADVVYVAYGAAVTYGIDLDAVLIEVHRSNMSKLGADGRPILREDGKVLKSEGYSRPDIAAVLSQQLPLPF